MSAGRMHLRLDRELGCEKALRLILCRVGSIDDVIDKLRTKLKRQIVTVNISGLILIDDEEIIPLLAHGDIGVFPQLDIAVRAQDEEPSIAPCAEPKGSEPIEP